MSESGKSGDNYFAVWLWLVALTVGYLLERWVGIPRRWALVVIFGIAFWKASLVALNFMHLKRESPVIYAIAAVPIVLFAILVLLLLPDITLIHTGGK